MTKKLARTAAHDFARVAAIDVPPSAGGVMGMLEVSGTASVSASYSAADE